MAAKHRLVKATVDDARNLMRVLRPIHRVEFEVMYQKTVEEELSDKMLAPPAKAWAAYVGGDVAAMFGVAPATLCSDIGRPWLLTGNRIHDHGREFLRFSRGYLDLLTDGYTELENWMYTDNPFTDRWLRWLGFEAMEVVVGLPARRYVLRCGND